MTAVLTTKLQLNDDGTIGVPVKGASPRTIMLTEPSMDELAQMHDLAVEADKALPTIPKVDTDSPPDEIQRALDVANERARMTYSADSPHGKAFVAIVNLLMPEENVTTADVYGWAMNPRTLRKVLDHFTAPLGGAEAAADREQQMREVRAALGA